MNQLDIMIQLDEIIRRYAEQSYWDYYSIWENIKAIARHRGLTGKPMEPTGWLLIAKDILPIIDMSPRWEPGA